MNSFDERPEVLDHFTGKHSYSTKVVVDDNVFLLYGRKMGKATGIHHAGIVCQDTGIWIATLDSIMVKVDDGKSIERMTFGYVALRSDGETVAMCLSHTNFNGGTSFYEFSEVNLIDLGLSTTLQELVIQRFGDESNPSNDSNPMLIPFKHAEEKAKEAWERQQVETTNKVSATAMSLVVSEVDESMDDLLTFKTANAKLSVTDNEREEEAADMKEEAADVDIEMKREGSDPNSAEKVGTDDPISPTDDPVLLKRPRKLSGKEKGQKKKTRSSVRDPVPRKHYANEQEHPRAKVETEKKAAMKSNPKPKAIPKPNSTPKPTKQVRVKGKEMLSSSVGTNARSAPQAGSEVHVAQARDVNADKTHKSAGDTSASVAKELKAELTATKMEMQKAMREMLSSIQVLASQKISTINGDDDDDDGSGPSTRSGRRRGSAGKPKTSSKAASSTQNGLPPVASNAQSIAPSAVTTQGFFSMGPSTQGVVPMGSTAQGFVPMGPTTHGSSHMWPTPIAHGFPPSTVPAGHSMLHPMWGREDHSIGISPISHFHPAFQQRLNAQANPGSSYFSGPPHDLFGHPAPVGAGMQRGHPMFMTASPMAGSRYLNDFSPMGQHGGFYYS